MARVQKITTKATFIDGRYVPKGFPVMVDTAKLSGRETNFAEPGPNVGGSVQMAAVAPSGPNPQAPQQVPHDAVQTVEGHVMPGGVRLVGETTAPDLQAAAAAEAYRGAAAQAEAANNADDALVDARLADIIPTLGDKSAEELEALRAAEVDHETPRKTLIAALDKALAARKG